MRAPWLSDFPTLSTFPPALTALFLTCAMSTCPLFCVPVWGLAHSRLSVNLRWIKITLVPVMNSVDATLRERISGRDFWAWAFGECCYHFRDGECHRRKDFGKHGGRSPEVCFTQVMFEMHFGYPSGDVDQTGGDWRPSLQGDVEAKDKQRGRGLGSRKRLVDQSCVRTVTVSVAFPSVCLAWAFSIHLMSKLICGYCAMSV